MLNCLIIIFNQLYISCFRTASREIHSIAVADQIEETTIAAGFKFVSITNDQITAIDPADNIIIPPTDVDIISRATTITTYEERAEIESVVVSEQHLTYDKNNDEITMGFINEDKGNYIEPSLPGGPDDTEPATADSNREVTDDVSQRITEMVYDNTETTNSETTYNDLTSVTYKEVTSRAAVTSVYYSATVSQDITTVKNKDKQQKPTNNKRLDYITKLPYVSAKTTIADMNYKQAVKYVKTVQYDSETTVGTAKVTLNTFNRMTMASTTVITKVSASTGQNSIT
jgi:hypothetical protein